MPVVLDVGTNNQDLLNDPLYLGMSHPRLEGEDYYSFVDEWVAAVRNRWPGKLEKSKKSTVYLHSILLDTLIQFEDFKYPHAYNLLNKCKLPINYT